MTLEENRVLWAGYDWSHRGEEWSAWWGTSKAQWEYSIRLRIAKYLPSEQILEIATGCGRWTQFLIQECSSFWGVDLNPLCVESCRRRFCPLYDHCSFRLTDGRSLPAGKDGSFDFAFSFDSLVHADESVLASYLMALAKKLKPGGAAFIHHSNAGECAVKGGLRDPNMTAGRFAELCASAGMACEAQELVDWCSDELTDCFSTVVNRPPVEPLVICNYRFRHEMAQAKERSHG